MKELGVCGTVVKPRERQANTATQKRQFIPVFRGGGGGGKLYTAILKPSQCPLLKRYTRHVRLQSLNRRGLPASEETRHSGFLPLPLGHTRLRGCPAEPLGPGAIVDGHIRLAAEVGGQGDVAGSDSLPARGNEGLR